MSVSEWLAEWISVCAWFYMFVCVLDWVYLQCARVCGFYPYVSVFKCFGKCTCVCVCILCVLKCIYLCLYRDIYIMHMYFLRTYPCVGAYIFMYDKGWVVQRGFMYVGGEVPICYICKGIHVTECVNETHRISTLITKINYFSISILMINTRGAQNF